MGFQALPWQLPTSYSFDRGILLPPAVIHKLET